MAGYLDLPATLPGAGTAVATSTTSTTAIDLSTNEGRYVWIYVSALTYLRAGASTVGASVAAEDVAFPIGTHRFFVAKGKSYVRAILASGTGVLQYGTASE